MINASFQLSVNQWNAVRQQWDNFRYHQYKSLHFTTIMFEKCNVIYSCLQAQMMFTITVTDYLSSKL